MPSQSDEKRSAAELNARGIRFTDAGKLEDARTAFTDAIALDATMPGIFFNRAEAKRLSGDFAGARSDLLEAMRLSPGEPDFIHAIGLLSYEEDDFQTAAELYQKAIELQPDFAQAWNDLGVIHFRKSRYGEARGCFEKAVALDAGMAEAWFNLADTYDELGLKAERARALEALKKANMMAEYRAESRE
ncbi:MAG: tetratricopeptide repeat protein [Spirochaetales bacterium]